ncbi:2-C-methyl-D-erythritol 4-phosphate cytidylyltransferase [bacterium]|nr:2-C-methyl-D-erythritol 4-phosphate cytidylyltransferase [bacterium]
MKACALIPAAGRGERFGRPVNKVFAEIAGKPILAHTISVFESCEAIGEIIIVAGKNEIEAVGELVDRFGFGKVTHITEGGKERQDSVYRGLEKVTSEIVAIHDAARPMVTCDIISRSIDEAQRSGACIVAVPVIDTIKSVTPQCMVSDTIDRSNLYCIQTPQTFKIELIKKAYDQAYADGYYATDDSALVERIGEKVAIVQGSYDNIKITTPSDMELASMKLGAGIHRSGIGFDVHAFAEGRKLVLGGIDIPYEKGLAGHSDADVIIHAIMDALLGAAALGDIGRHFPDSDPSYKGISSIKLLTHVGNLLAKDGWHISNIDAVVICEQPKISPHVKEMVKGIAECLKIETGCINIKGTTTEKLGFTGRGEGIACQAIATLNKV